MKRLLFAFLSGLLFGGGLSMSTMLDRHKIINFLDIAGDWDPTLLFVMAGAVFVTVIFFRFILARPAPIYDSIYHFPLKKHLDVNLIVGAATFGLGWGLTGYCPGPGFAAITLGLQGPLVFCGGYIIGSVVSKYFPRSFRK